MSMWANPEGVLPSLSSDAVLDDPLHVEGIGWMPSGHEVDEDLRELLQIDAPTRGQPDLLCIIARVLERHVLGFRQTNGDLSAADVPHGLARDDPQREPDRLRVPDFHHAFYAVLAGVLYVAVDIQLM